MLSSGVETDKSSFADNNMDYQRIISERRNEIYEKLKNGDTEESFQIGGSSFTEKEWDKLLSEVDAVRRWALISISAMCSFKDW